MRRYVISIYLILLFVDPLYITIFAPLCDHDMTGYIQEKKVIDLRPGEVAMVKRFSDADMACKLITLGIIPNCQITMIKRAPFGGAYCIKLGQTLIAVRKEEAESIIIS